MTYSLPMAVETMRPSRMPTTRSATARTLGSWVTIEQRPGLALGEVAEELEDLVADVAVEVGGRLVGEQDRRRAGQRAGDRHALLLPAGEVARQKVAAVRKPHRLDHPLGLLAARRGRAGP